MEALKSVELRIGNYYIENKKIRTVRAADILNLERMESNGFNSDMNPIPISKEWLVNFGFDNDKEVCWEKFEQMRWVKYENNYICVRLMKHDFAWWIILEINASGEHIGINIGDFEYVHQLQNLYFALTGKELKVD
jgi:hypothetical protein